MKKKTRFFYLILAILASPIPVGYIFGWLGDSDVSALVGGVIGIMGSLFTGFVGLLVSFMIQRRQNVYKPILEGYLFPAIIAWISLGVILL